MRPDLPLLHPRPGLRRRGRARAVAGGVALALVGALGACSDDGGDAAAGTSPSSSASPSAAREDGPLREVSGREVLARAREAVAGASSVVVTGELTQGPQTLTVDVRLSRDSGSAGTVQQAGERVDLVSLPDGRDFVRSPGLLASFGLPPQDVETLSGRYLEVPDGQAPGLQFASLTEDLLVGPGSDEPGAVVQRGGEDVLEVTGLGPDGVLQVALDGPPLPVAVRGTGATSGETVFSAWGEPVGVEAPPDPVGVEELRRLVEAARPPSPSLPPGAVGPAAPATPSPAAPSPAAPSPDAPSLDAG